MDTTNLAKLILLFLAITLLGTTMNSCSNKNSAPTGTSIPQAIDSAYHVYNLEPSFIGNSFFVTK